MKKLLRHLYQALKKTEHFPQNHNSTTIKYSNLDEERIIKSALDMLSDRNNFCVDIAASDGTTMSNTYNLYKLGYPGLAVEYDNLLFSKLSESYKEFYNVGLIKSKVTPNNISYILKSFSTPIDFDFLSFDIDSYDYFVLDKLLNDFRPKLVCAEINEKIPPPYKFSVIFNESHYWKNDHFYGMSICKVNDLTDKHKYKIINLHYNNVFLVPEEYSFFKGISAVEAYKDGYENKIDRLDKFPWNKDMENLLYIDYDNGINFLTEKFKSYNGLFELQ